MTPHPHADSDRREFLRRTALAVGGAFASGGLAWLFHNRRLVPQPAPAASIPRFDVDGTGGSLVIARGPDGARCTAAALAQLGGIRRFISPNDRVLVKPNCAFDRPAYLGATVSPAVMGEVVRQCRSAGADVRVTDNPINDPRGCFIKSGVEAAVTAAGGRLWLPDPGMIRRVTVGSLRIREWEVLYTPLRWATKVIGVATVKSHNLCAASLCLKNWYGLLDGPRSRLHQSIHEVIADLGAFMTPTLVVLDGTRILARNGPTGGSPADVRPGDSVAVGTDAVAADVYGVRLLGLTPDDVPYLARAAELGVGKLETSALTFFREITT